MNHKRIALVNYTPSYFLPFGQALEQTGFETYWVNSLHSDALFLSKHGIPVNRNLDTTAFDPSTLSLEECRTRLSLLEGEDRPRINDIIMMDRLLRTRKYDYAIKYLGHLEKVVTAFLQDNRIALVSSGRDTALQLLTMLICRRLSIPWVVPTRVRIPQEMYGFCQRHDTEGLIRFREVTSEDRAWAERFLDDFSKKSLRPALKKSARGLVDVLRLLPVHARAFVREIQKSIVDSDSYYVRYTIPSLIRMYIRRRINLLKYVLFTPYADVGNGPFCLYAMHTQPESSIDVVGSYFSDQMALITFISRSLPISHELYVKIHPTDVDGQTLAYYRRIAKIPGVRLIGHAVDSRDLLQQTSLVFTVSGTIAYEAGLMGKPVVTFARNFFNNMPTIHFCDAPPRLMALVDSLLDSEVPGDIHDQLIEFLAGLRASSFDGEVNRSWDREGGSPTSLAEKDLATLQTAYDHLYHYWHTPS